MWKKNLELYDAAVAKNPLFERVGKTVPHTAANGYMFSVLNKEGELGFRLSKESGERFIEEQNSTRFKSHGSFMQGYVLIPQAMMTNTELLGKYLQESYDFVMSMEHRDKKKRK